MHPLLHRTEMPRKNLPDNRWQNHHPQRLRVPQLQQTRTREGKGMSFTEKIDVLDLLINIIKEHEEKLDELIRRLENL